MTTNTSDEIFFNFTYEALKLLGKGLYSNVWSALSELIANGIDAHATRVDVFINMQDKQHSTIEILDNGDGMDYDEIKDNYVVIGKNKRDGAPDSDTLMGRKGVGKLAALFLSKKYVFTTKKKDQFPNTWGFDFDDKSTENPCLRKIENIPITQTMELFNKCQSGTLLRLEDVNLSNMAEEAINALSLIMSNYFLYENLPGVKVNFYVINSPGEIFDYENPLTMCKKVAFKNMIALYGDKEIFSKIGKSSFKYPLEYNESFEKNEFERERENISFNKIELTKGSYEIEVNGKNIKIPYALKGWIGIHSTIQQSDAQKNDSNFVKNKYYNPNRLRLYIRNKLAVNDFLSYLKNTQQGINYIEGEISFDLLDSDLLEDITTSNRQDIDIHDQRVSRLIDITKKIVNSLIEKRNDVTKQANIENQKRKEIIESTAKVNAKSSIKNDLNNAGYKSRQIKKILNIVTNKFKGNIDLKAKDIYKVFISHSKKDRRFSDFIYNLLLKKGAKKEDIFYTTTYVGGETNLTDAIKDNIMEHNVLVFFLDTVNFNKSQYCLFEGGAFWATRSIEDCIHVHTGMRWIPDYINDTRKYHVPLSNGTTINKTIFDLTPKKYDELCDIFNIIINHLNKSSVHLEAKIDSIKKVGSVSEIELERTSKDVKTLMDKDFLEFWNYYVVSGKTDTDSEGKIISNEDYIKMYNETVKVFED